MATAKKAAAKKAAKPTKAAAKAPQVPQKRSAAQSETKYTMPTEVANWIERANSTIQHLKGQIDRLKTENNELKAYKKWAEHRILRSDHE